MRHGRTLAVAARLCRLHIQELDMPVIGYESCVALPLAVWDIWPHGVILLVLILVLFGGRKLPELARGLARGMRIFRDELHGVKTDLEDTKPLPPAEQLKKIDSKPAEPSQEKKDPT
jgi:sec-independent protein translocase protein TatA